MKREKILIVEDEIDLLNLIDFNLTRKGFLTVCAMDGEEALEKVGSEKPGLVILDLMIPKVDGWEVCRTIRALKNDIPVIMLTAKSMPEDKVKGLESGADDYITKPFNMKELIIRIEKLLDVRRNYDIHSMFFHEVSNRVAAIGGFSKLLSDCGSSGESRAAYLRKISDEVICTSELIFDYGCLISLESAGLGAKPCRCEVGAVISSIAESYMHTASQRGVKVRIDADRDCVIEADPFVIRQIFTNLIGNAVKYCNDGDFVVIVVRKALDQALVIVKDNGVGIPAEDLPHIFDKGFRARNASKTAKGSGLGLYIVSKFLEKMGAKIEARSVEGKGAEFRVIFRAQLSTALRRCV